LVLAAVGLVFVLWPETGVVAVSWLIAAGAALIGGLLIFLAIKLRRLRAAVDNLGSQLSNSRE
jgi:LPXTG-motif cell wall-anchored protein